LDLWTTLDSCTPAANMGGGRDPLLSATHAGSRVAATEGGLRGSSDQESGSGKAPSPIYD